MRVLIATGGSGGHIFPAIKVGLECQTKGYPCLFVGSLKFGIDRLKQNDLEFSMIETCGWGGIKIFKAIYLSIKATYYSFKIFKSFHPDVVIGFGGYSSFPVCLAARLKRIPTLIHEQNVIPGKANKALSPMVQKILVSFTKSSAFFPQRKCVLTGCPSLIQDSIVSTEEALSFFGFVQGKYTILVFGGSQGSQKINTVFLESIGELSRHVSLQVIHVIGSEDGNEAEAHYVRLGVQAFVVNFLDRMDYAYKAADLVIARAGALTVTEILCFQKAAIFIPYPHAEAHQKENARVLTSSGFAVMMEDMTLTASALTRTIRNQYERHKSEDKRSYTEEYLDNPAGHILEEASTLAALYQ